LLTISFFYWIENDFIHLIVAWLGIGKVKCSTPFTLYHQQHQNANDYSASFGSTLFQFITRGSIALSVVIKPYSLSTFGKAVDDIAKDTSAFAHVQMN
jgi:hypothetical protein